MKALECKGQVSVNDYVEFARFNMFKGKYYRMKVMAIPFAASVISIFLIYIAFLKANLIYALGVIVLIIMLRTIFSSFKTKGKRMYVANAKYARATQHTVFGKNGFITELSREGNETEHNEFLFDEVYCIYMAPAAIYVYMGRNSVFILPMRNLKVSAQDAVNYLKAYAPAEKLVICA